MVWTEAIAKLKRKIPAKLGRYGYKKCFVNKIFLKFPQHCFKKVSAILGCSVNCREKFAAKNIKNFSIILLINSGKISENMQGVECFAC